jgi:hypothetical protein
LLLQEATQGSHRTFEPIYCDTVEGLIMALIPRAS